MMNSVDSMSSISSFTNSIKNSPSEVLLRKPRTDGAAIDNGPKTENNVVKFKQKIDSKNPSDLVDQLNNDGVAEEELLIKQEEEEEFVYPPPKDGASIDSFESLAVAVGAVNGKITKQQLIGYLQGLIVETMHGEGNIDEVKYLRGILSQFDNISHGEDYITSLNGADFAETYGKKQDVPPISTMEMEA